MKILLLSPGLYPGSTGGLEVYNYHFINSLKAIHEVKVITYYKNSKAFPNMVYPLFFRRNSLNFLFIVFYLVFKKHDRLILTYTSNSPVVYPFLFASFLKKQNSIVHIHGGGLKKWKRPWINRTFFNKVQHIVGVSERITREYQSRTGKNILTIFPIIPTQISQLSKEECKQRIGTKEHDRVLFYAGSLKKIKGSTFLVESLIKLGKEFYEQHQLKAILAGDGELLQDLRNKVNEAGFEKYIQLPGRKEREEIPVFMKASEIFINASWYEGTPLTIIEALNNNLLVISANVPGISEVINHGKTGLLYRKEDFMDFKQNLLFALENREKTKIIAQNGFEDVKAKYKFECNMNLHLNLINT